MSAPYLSTRLQGFGTTVFAEMSALAVATGSINLGQGFPDEPGPPEVLDVARAAIGTPHDQYPPGPGQPDLRAAIAEHQQRFRGLTYDPADEVLVTAGATEALTAALIALLEPGDEVVLFEPMYDSYAAAVAMAGGVLRPVPLRPPAVAAGEVSSAPWTFDEAELRAAVTPRARLLLLNTPHNPTGKVFTPAELAVVADVAQAADLLVLTDEVYEHLLFDDEVHIPISTLPGMAERTLTVSSAGKTFSVTGWKIGWATGPAELVAKVLGVKQWFSFASGTPLQYAVATGLELPDDRFAAFGVDLGRKRDLLTDGLRELGMEVYHSRATYFVTADIAPLGETDSLAFCRALPERVGVAAVPNQVFHASPEGVETQVRFACCKRDDVLADALLRLRKL